MVFEDIPWDDFERPRYNYPNKRDLLSCQKTMLTVVYRSFQKYIDKYLFLCFILLIRPEKKMEKSLD
jgi:hypothetical protein